MTWLVARQVCTSAHQALRSHGWVVPLRISLDGLATAVGAARRFHDDGTARWS